MCGDAVVVVVVAGVEGMLFRTPSGKFKIPKSKKKDNGNHIHHTLLLTLFSPLSLLLSSRALSLSRSLVHLSTLTLLKQYLDIMRYKNLQHVVL